MRRRIAAVLLVLSLLLCCGCSAQEQTHQELTLQLPKDFVDLSAEPYAEDFDFLYQNSAVAVAGIRESKASLLLLDFPSAQYYAQIQMKRNDLPGQPEQKDGIWYFSYEAVSAGTPMTYICAVYECETCFWLVQTYCKSEAFPAQQEAMWEYLSSVTVDGQ